MFFNLENKWKTAHLKPPKYFKSLLKHCCTDNTHDVKYPTLAFSSHSLFVCLLFFSITF